MEGPGRVACWTAAAVALGVASCSSDGVVVEARVAGFDSGAPGADASLSDAGPTGNVDAGLDGTPADASQPDRTTTGPPTVPSLLSQTGLFKSVAADGSLVLQEGVRPYEPLYALWADGAQKTRWIYLPPGTAIDTTDMDHWSFPPGTKFWKEFSLLGGRLETRLLWIYGPGAGDFLLASYWWNPEAGMPDDAEMADPFLGAQQVNGTTHDIPSQQDCHTCHDSLEEHVLGFGAIELNHTLSGTNIHTLMDAGALTTSPNLAELAIPGDSRAQAAMGYLHANCGICHNVTPGATGIPTPAMILRLSVGATTIQQTKTYQTAVNVATTDFTSFPYRIEGQNPSNSGVIRTMMTRDNSRQEMPPLASKEVDDAGVAAVTAWIDELPKP